jgi:2'-5' RNA ligase
MHLTLRFLGDIQEDDVGRIGKLLAETFSFTDGFEIQFSGLGTFGKRMSPSVLYARIADKGRLETLYQALAKATYEILPLEKKKVFLPHLTLARMKMLKDPDKIIHLLESYGEKDLGKAAMQKVVLFRSILTSEGPEYTVLSEVKLLSSAGV